MQLAIYRINIIMITQNSAAALIESSRIYIISVNFRFCRFLLAINTYPECTSYSWLNESNRNNNYYETSSQRCDNSLATGWYRFGGRAGTHMSTSCPYHEHCSANHAGFLNSDHPKLHEGIVTRSVCFRNGGHCCYWGDTIKVLNCGMYYVYKLHRQTHCNRRYCGSF